MESIREPRIVSSVRDVAEAIRFAKASDGALGKVIFLIGAGCSISAGIPGAAAIARHMATDMATRFCNCDSAAGPVAAYNALVAQSLLDRTLTGALDAEPTDSTINWYGIYDEMFQRHYRVPDDVRDLFGNLLAKTNGAINWAHLCLGELVNRRYVSTVLTTNFDQLVLSGMVRAGVLPVVSDGIESLNRISGAPRHPQLVELHGSRHTYLLRNAPEDVEALRSNSQASAAIQKLFQNATAFVAVGYGGREDGVMDILIEAAGVYPDKNLFWVSHSPRPDAIGPKVQKFLATSRNGGLLVGQDADHFFLELCRELGVGAPRAVADPLGTVERVITDLSASNVSHPDIQAEIDAVQARLRRLQTADAEAQRSDAVAVRVTAIREARLAGDLSRAYELADNALEPKIDLDTIDVGLLEETALTALLFGQQAPDKVPLTRAVERFEALLRSSAGGSAERARWTTLLGEALTWLGERHGDSTRLLEALRTLELGTTLINRRVDPLAWADLQNKRGNALATLGGRESGTARLEEAVAAYHGALEERTRERVPLDWASTQNNLGAALQKLGERESRADRLEEAVAAYRAALQERTRNRVPLDWARTQNNLGTVLHALGEREAGTDRLEEAVVAYRAALEERTRQLVPLDWATTQNNLGNALRTLGTRGNSVARLQEAIAAYHAALEEYTRERVPLDWAMTQNNLAGALFMLGERESGTARLLEAIATYRTTLDERTRERVPLRWAMTQNNIGAALQRVGEREGGTLRMWEAVSAYRAALEERTRELAPRDWAETRYNLAVTQFTLSQLLWDAGLLQEAIDSMRSAEQVYRNGGDTYWQPIARKWLDDMEAQLSNVVQAR